MFVAATPSLSQRFSRRELNFAESRLNLLSAASRLAEAEGLEPVSADVIAARAGVSRQTFFNRFPEKDALLLFFAWTWWFGDTVAHALEPRRGFAGIRRIFQRVADAEPGEKRLLQGFTGYIARGAEARPLLDAMRLTRAEKALLRPRVAAAADMQPVPLPGLLKAHAREAVEDGQVHRDTDVPALVTDLGAALYGELLMATVTGARDLWPRYERQLERIEGWAGGSQSRGPE